MIVSSEITELQIQIEEYFPDNEAEPYVLLEKLMTLMWDGGVDWGTEENGAMKYAEGYEDGYQDARSESSRSDIHYGSDMS
jgi:hypothetical protein